jgi:V/A-type H+/Na+-transporting ATPase subunit I
MFFPKAMTEVELIVPSKDLLAVTKVLGTHGEFHQIDSTYLGLQNTGLRSWQEKAAAYAAVERRLQVLMPTLGLAEEFVARTPNDSLTDLEAIRPAVERIEGDVKETNAQLTAEKKRLEQLEAQLQQLAPIADVDIEVGALQKSKYVYSLPGILPAANVSRLETSLGRVPHVLFTLREDAQKPLVWLLGPRSHSDVIDRAARSAYLAPLSLPDEFQGTPAEVTKALIKAIADSRKKIDVLEGELRKLAETHQSQLRSLLWEVHISRLTADAMARFGELRHTYVVVGWVPSSELETLRKRLTHASKEILIEARAISPSDHRGNVPVALRNPGILGAFELMVNTYARPRYEELDPTVLIALTFPLLYGAMYGDVGHGLVLATFGALVARRVVKMLPAWIGRLLVVCGLSGMIFGFLFGSIFGFEDILPQSPVFGRFVAIQPLHSIIQILAIAIGAGVVLLNAGILLNMFTALRARNWPRFFFDSNGLAGWILYLSFLLLVGQLVGTLFLKRALFPPVVVPLAGVGMLAGTLAAVVFSEPLKRWMEGHRPLIEGGTAMFFVQSGAEVLEKFISMFSNTLSYVRVGAFAIVHAGFTNAVFVMAKLLGGGHEGGVAYWVVVIVGNIGVIALEGFIVWIQTMRLHYYEFFSKFFTGGGSAYEPLALGTAKESQA